MKLSSAFNYRFKAQLKNLSIVFSAYTIMTLVFPFINLFRGITYNSSPTSILFPTMCFVLGATLAFVNMDFKLFIQNGMSRNNIFISYLLSIISTSTLTTFFVLLLQELAEQLFTKQIRFSLFLVDIYSPNNVFIAFFILFSLLNMIGSIGLLIGTFNLRFNNFIKFITLGFIIFLPSLIGATLYYIGPSTRSSLFSILKLVLGITKDRPIPFNLILTIFILTISFLIMSFLMMRKSEIKRINA